LRRATRLSDDVFDAALSKLFEASCIRREIQGGISVLTMHSITQAYFSQAAPYELPADPGEPVSRVSRRTGLALGALYQQGSALDATRLCKTGKALASAWKGDFDVPKAALLQFGMLLGRVAEAHAGADIAAGVFGCLRSARCRTSAGYRNGCNSAECGRVQSSRRHLQRRNATTNKR